MDGRTLLGDLNLLLSVLGACVAGLTAAFLTGRWFGSLIANALREKVSDLDRRNDRLEHQIAIKDQRIETLDARLNQVVPLPDGARPPVSLPPEAVQVWLREVSAADQTFARTAKRIPTLVVANLKGGVAKTMLAANIATYFATRGHYPNTRDLLSKRVLLIDLDYQGSLSGMILTAVGAVDPSYSVDCLFDGSVSAQDALLRRVHPSEALRGVSLFPSTYGFDDFETREQFNWLFSGVGDDLRFRLLRKLSSPEFAAQFDLVIIDTGPRLTTGSVGALAAATHLLIPTTTDVRSVEAVTRFLRRVSRLKDAGVCPSIKLAGVVATLVGGTAAQVTALSDARAKIQSTVDANPELSGLIDGGFRTSAMLRSSMERTQTISLNAETTVPYLVSAPIRAIFNQIGLEIEQRLT